MFENVHVKILIRQKNSNGPIDDAIGPIHKPRGLVRISSVIPRGDKRRVRQIQLAAPPHKPGRARTGGGDVRIVRPDGLAGGVVLEQDLLPHETQRLGFVPRDSGAAAVAGRVEILAAATGSGEV